jgi:hypothetical protein
MSKASTISRLIGTSVLTLVLATALVGCSGDGSDSDGASAKATASPSASPYLPVPDGVELTPQGTQLELGDPGVVAYEPRQDEVGVLDLSVTKLEQTTVRRSLSAWQLTPEQKASTPYFVHVNVRNVGETDLGGRRVPLYAVNEDNLLLESTPFASSFTACPSTALPAEFLPGAAAKMCLVYLAPDRGTLEAVSFRPEETFDPITWKGEITRYVPPKPAKKK